MLYFFFKNGTQHSYLIPNIIVNLDVQSFLKLFKSHVTASYLFLSTYIFIPTFRPIILLHHRTVLHGVCVCVLSVCVRETKL